MDLPIHFILSCDCARPATVLPVVPTVAYSELVQPMKGQACQQHIKHNKSRHIAQASCHHLHQHQGETA